MTFKPDRTNRNLAALEKSGSTSRVLNLLAVSRASSNVPEYSSAPFFNEKALNRSILLKHRLRLDEYELFEDARQNATKIIIPFSNGDLKLGGRSVFIGQNGWVDMLRDVCGARESSDRDIVLLNCLDQMPSLDPFLLREQLKIRGYNVAQCYFAISPADLAKMQAFVAGQIKQLIGMAYRGYGGGSENYTAKLVAALLSTEVDDRLEPLRKTLNLDGEAYREGVFSWRGFLYYKWVLTSLQPLLKTVMEEMNRISLSGPQDPEALHYISISRQRVQRSIVEEMKYIAKALSVYDQAFHALTVEGNPQGFVGFLRKAPGMFVELGERIGMASHISSFWRYRFPTGARLRATVEETADLFSDFETGLGVALAA
jgi:hypothetical protein